MGQLPPAPLNPRTQLPPALLNPRTQLPPAPLNPRTQLPPAPLNPRTQLPLLEAMTQLPLLEVMTQLRSTAAPTQQTLAHVLKMNQKMELNLPHSLFLLFFSLPSLLVFCRFFCIIQ